MSNGVTHTPEQVERGLTALVLCGSSVNAGRETGISPDTLRSWRRTTHADRYRELRAELLPKIQAKIAQDAEDLAIRYAEAEHEALDALNVNDLKPDQLAQALPRLATARGISTDKSLILHGQPTVITEHRSGPEILAAIARKAPAAITDDAIDSTATEITDAQEVPSLPAVQRQATS